MNKTNTHCPACDLICNKKLLTTKDFNRHVSDLQFDYFKCESCETVFINHVPDNFSDYYAGEYPAYNMPKASELENRASMERHKINLVMKYMNGNSLLEIGPSFGAFLYLASRQGYRVEAIEMDPECCTYIADTIGVTVHQTSDVNACLAGLGAFDAITLWHVIEHLQFPSSILKTISEHLNPGGILVIASPNPKSLEFMLFKRCWVHLDAPRHLSFVPLNTLANLAKKAGLTIVHSAVSGSSEAPYNTFWWFKKSLVNLLSDVISNQYIFSMMETLINVPTTWKLTNIPIRVLNIFIKLVYFTIWQPIVLLYGASNSYTVLFRKD